MNNVSLVGRLKKDPELKYTANGKANVVFTLAVNRRPDKDGKVTADFIRCLAWNKTAEFIAQYFKKGMAIGLDGQIRTGSYKREDGTTIYTTDVLVNSVEFVERKQASGTASEEPLGTEIEFSDDELPFDI